MKSENVHARLAEDAELARFYIAVDWRLPPRTGNAARCVVGGGTVDTKHDECGERTARHAPIHFDG